ncbi:MAG: DUF2207 domain-containing protein, partial [Firmicutes bacterium]|nr:DUF2207 domain-containing protein [Bacillota bacterium]
MGIFLFALVQFAEPVRADDRSYYFPMVHIEAEIHPDGSMSVVENRTFRFRGRYRGAWEYILLKHNASIRDVMVSEGGEPYRQEAPGTQDIPGIFYVEQQPGRIYIDWSFEALNEQRTFAISYMVENAVLAHQDVAELYYQFIGDEWEERTNHARVVLTLPENVTAEELGVWGHGPLYGSVWKEGENQVIWEVKDLPKKTFLEGRVVFPLRLVPNAANISGKEGLAGILAEEEKWAAEANRKRRLARVDVFAGIPIILGAMILYLVLRLKAFKHPQAYQGDYYRDLPGDYSPAEAGHFFRLGRTTPEDITATLMDLTRRGYLILQEYQAQKGLIFKSSFTDYRIYPGEGRGTLVGHESKLIR